MYRILHAYGYTCVCTQNSPDDPHIGWRTEFRSMEVQLTDFENAAFTVFVVLVTRVILAFDLALYIPLSKVSTAPFHSTFFSVYTVTLFANLYLCLPRWMRTCVGPISATQYVHKSSFSASTWPHRPPPPALRVANLPAELVIATRWVCTTYSCMRHTFVHIHFSAN